MFPDISNIAAVIALQKTFAVFCYRNMDIATPLGPLENTHIAGLHVPKKRFFFFSLTYAEIRTFNWLKSIFLESAKKKELPKRTAFLGHVNRL